MCGIVGIVRSDGETVSRDLLERMTASLAHRGPDADGFHLEEGVGLGHRRLMIIDLDERSNQPLYDESGELVVVYNGEIYNHAELRAELETKGHRFRTLCDTEVILYAYREYGRDCPRHLRGMFAFAIHDREKNETFLARDRVGIKPLYYWQDERHFVFGSEIKAIVPALDRKPSVNHDAIDFYMSLGYVPGELTLFAGLNKLPPGHSLHLRNGQAEIQRYWDLSDIRPLSLSYEEAVHRFDALLDDCIRMRLMSDVPLGAFLSGGLDSSAVVARMSAMTSEPIKTFSVGYRDDPASNELGFARVIAEHFKTEHHEFILEPTDFFESLDLLLHHSEEPIVESAAIALFHLSRLAREHVTVILSGEGGDEALAGYPLYPKMRKLDRMHALARMLPGFVADPLCRGLGRTEKLVKYLDWVRAPLRDRFQGISNDVTVSIKRSMYEDSVGEQLSERTRRYFQELHDALPQGSALQRMSYADIKTWLPDDLLLKADKMTMASSLELRVPFLDHEMLEFCVALPDDLRLRGEQGKYLLKKHMETQLPHEIIYRKKMGFPVPVRTWFRGKLYERVRETLLDPRCLSRGYFKPAYIERMIRRHREGKEDLSRRIFTMLTLETWHRMYLD